MDGTVMVAAAAGHPLAAPAEHVLSSRLTDSTLTHALTDAALASSLVDEVLAGVAADPVRHRRPRGMRWRSSRPATAPSP